MGKQMIEVAREEFAQHGGNFAKSLEVIAIFLISNPELAPKPKRGDTFGTQEYWKCLSEKFLRGRNPRTPRQPSTIPDHMVGIILQEYFGLDADSISRAVKEHSLSMAAENIIGDLLERYIASELEPYGWVWCSGEVVKKVDFLALKKGRESEWIPVQIKNRDNSENSSSSSVRDGTEIVKWFRTFSRTGATNWEEFPEMVDEIQFSEKSFNIYARNYLRKLSNLK